MATFRRVEASYLVAELEHFIRAIIATTQPNDTLDAADQLEQTRQTLIDAIYENVKME